jgi:hypothetical protein
MKKIFIFPVVFIFLSVSLIAGAYLEKFTAQSDNGNVAIEWKTAAERNIKYFEIERRSGNSEDFISINSFSPMGDNSTYKYVDKTAYKSTDAVYIYRLKIIDNDNSVTYSSQVVITHRVSSVKSTWGSIKSMFR